jgi:adenylate cyclase
MSKAPHSLREPNATRPWLSYRVSLLFVVPLLVVLTGAAIAANSYITTRDSIANLADSVFDQAAKQASDEARAHVRQAATAADLLSSILLDPQETSDVRALAENLLAVLRANKGFTWVSYSDEDGTFTGARRRPDGSILINRSTVTNGKTITDENLVQDDNSWIPVRHREDMKYDPRTRPFYTKVRAEKKRVWTDPYVFFDEAVPGITCAAPVFARDGKLRGVVTVDFDLNVLSDFVRTLHTSEHERVFVYTKSGAILAHPKANVVVKPAGGAEGASTIVTKDNIDDDVVRAYFGTNGVDVFMFGGERWFASTSEFPPEDGLEWSVGAVAPESDFMGAVDRTTKRALLYSFSAMIAAVVFAAWLSGRIARPLAALSTQMVKAGSLELEGADPPPSMFHEISMMNRALSAMKTGLKSFSLYVPKDLVRTMLASGEHAELGGKTKVMTIFFSDLAGFTSISEKLSPSELVFMLGGYFDEMTRIISDKNGTVDKFIGDAIMAFWNAPLDDDDHAPSAAEAALLCMRKLDEMKNSDPKLKDLAARIGVATGEVVVGNIGSRERMNYTVMGDTTNLASRLEGANKVYGTRILVGETTHEAAKDRVVMRAVDVLAVKGKKQGVRVYEPIALVSDKDERANERASLSEKALDAYLARRFDEALELYEKMLGLDPEDKAAELMRDRSKAHAATPPGEGWTGVTIATEK